MESGSGPRPIAPAGGDHAGAYLRPLTTNAKPALPIDSNILPLTDDTFEDFFTELVELPNVPAQQSWLSPDQFEYYSAQSSFPSYINPMLPQQQHHVVPVVSPSSHTASLAVASNALTTYTGHNTARNTATAPSPLSTLTAESTTIASSPLSSFNREVASMPALHSRSGSGTNVLRNKKTAPTHNITNNGLLSLRSHSTPSLDTVGRLQSIVQSLQQSGNLDEVNSLKLQLLEKDLIIEDLRSRINKAEQRTLGAEIPSDHSSSMHETALPTDRHLSTSQLKQRSNPSKVIKVRAAFDNASRQETALVRKLGSCLRCRGRKERCKPDILNPNGECINCALTSLSVHQIPCIRTRIPQVSLYHTVTTENDTWTIRPEIFGTEPTELSSALHTGVKILELTQDYGKPLVVRVTEFIPVDGDQTSYIWSIDGAELELPMPCYAITNIPETKAAMETYMVQNLERYIDSFIDRNDSVVWATFQIAIHRARYRNSILLQKMLRLWIASRMVEKAWHICGRETLGLSHADTAGTPYEGKIPIPPVMDSQFDQIMVRFILNPLRAQVLKILDSRITPGKRSEWFETYLVVSLLLNSITLSTAHDHKFAKLHRHVAAGRGSRFEDYNLIESYFHGAQVLIAHFRVIINGHRPLQSGSPDQIMISHEDLDDKEVRYITMIHSQLDTAISTANFLRKHNRYENIMYWTPNLFSTSWDPSPIYIKELEEGEADLIGSY